MHTTRERPPLYLHREEVAKLHRRIAELEAENLILAERASILDMIDGCDCIVIPHRGVVQ
jgi:hypothetical protein